MATTKRRFNQVKTAMKSSPICSTERSNRICSYAFLSLLVQGGNRPEDLPIPFNMSCNRSWLHVENYPSEPIHLLVHFPTILIGPFACFKFFSGPIEPGINSRKMINVFVHGIWKQIRRS